MALLKLLIILPVVLSVAADALGEESPVDVDVAVATRTIAVGDTFRLDIDLTWEDGVSVKPLALGEKVGAFAVRDIAYGPTVADAGRSRRRASVLLTVFETGTLTIPPIDVVYLDESGNAGKAETRPIDMEVESVLPDDAADIRDINRPIEVPRRWTDLILSWALLVGLGAIAAASMLISVKRREEIEDALRRFWLRVAGPIIRLVRRLLQRFSLIGRDEYGAPAFDARVAEPYLTPEQAALKELARIEVLRLSEQGRIDQLYTLVSETVRRYLERRFRVLAMESPTSFTVAAVGERDVDPDILSLIRAMLEETDLVKFAKSRPDAEAAGTLVERGRELVRAISRRETEDALTEVREP